MKRASLAPVLLILSLITLQCGGRQNPSVQIDTRPLDEVQAFEIIKEVLAERGYTQTKPVEISLANGIQFNCDLQITGHPIALEYVTAQDRATMGIIPPPAGGSRLHVLRGRQFTTDTKVPGQNIYTFFIDDQNFVYHYNPTSEIRANVTYLDVDARLRRDLADFLSWYEKDKAPRN